MLEYLKEHWKGLTISIIIAEAVGFISSLLSGNSREIYSQLIKPPLAPPGYLFGIVWPILYALMAIAAYQIYIANDSNEKEQALLIYVIQLLVNGLWSIVFFRFQSLWGSVLIIIILDILVVMTITAFNEFSKKATYLLYPYLLWILFATYLSIGFAFLN